LLTSFSKDYNPRIFDNPEEFRPSRWYDKLESELSFFGFGPRACLGRKFAMSEALALLIMILKNWRIEPVLEPNETTPEWRRRILQGGLVGLGFGIRPAPLRFVSRSMHESFSAGRT
jgi:cytochrome P450